MSERCLVTGGAGFIGSHLVEALVAQGHTVCILDSFATGRRASLDKVIDAVELVEGDVCDLALVQSSMTGIDVVFHLAALPSVPRSIIDPLASHAVNATGTLNILTAAHHAGVKRVIYASSSSVYGDNPDLPKREDMRTQPMSPYAVSKLAGENYCAAFSRVHGLSTICLRYFNVFGPRQDPTSQYAAVIPKFITAMAAGETPIIYGDGSQSRDFTYVGNVVDANLRAMAVPAEASGVFNIACGQRHTLLELVELLNAELGVRTQPLFAEQRAGDVPHSQAAIERAHSLLGYSPLTGFAEGLSLTVRWYADTGQEN